MTERLNQVRRSEEARIQSFINDLLSKNKFSAANPQGSTSPLIAYVNYVKLITERMDQVGVEFTAINTLLKQMNPLAPQAYNPSTPFGPPPGAAGLVTDSLDIPRVYIAQKNRDVHMDAQNGRYVTIRRTTNYNEFIPKMNVDGKSIVQYNDELNIYGPDRTTKDFAMIENAEAGVRSGVKGVATESRNGVPTQIPDYNSLFAPNRTGPAFGEIERGIGAQNIIRERIFEKSPDRKRKESLIENDDSFFNIQDFRRGYVTDSEEDSMFGDDEMYMPFFFQDLRRPDRKIFLQAFLTSFSETIGPQFSAESYYGRIDPVPVYKSTTRTFSIAFKLVAMSPEGFTAMWKKVNNLSKMMYPTYREGVISRAPALRVRVGDVLSDSAGRGLPCWVSSPMEFNYSNSTWEIESRTTNDSNSPQLGKAPMQIDVSVGITVIHEENPEVDSDYNWNIGNFRNIGLYNDGSGDDE